MREYKQNRKIIYTIIEPPKKFMEKFVPRKTNFIIDKFEEIMLKDIYRFDEITLEKINRNVTKVFKKWIQEKQEKKENFSLNAKGGTRTGKSLTMLAVCDTIQEFYKGGKNEKSFNPNYFVCANQKEYRAKLDNVDFGEVFQIDENAFSNNGLGSSAEMQQLKDVQNIIAKENIHTIYITPRMFLETNAALGLSTWGKDPKNWVSRMLLYDLRIPTKPISGYVIIDVGKLFYKYGCFLYKQLGGCTNPNRLSFKDLNKENLKYTSCIPKDYNREDLISNEKQCPFYNICKHPLSEYEHKKDSWIAKEMKGGMSDRVEDRYTTAIKLVPKIGFYEPLEKTIKLRSFKTKQLKIMINLYIGSISNTKYTMEEIDELVVMLQSFEKDINFYKETLKQLNLDFEEQLKKLPLEDISKEI